MKDSATVRAVGRRDDVIREAVSLLRRRGPTALTSVNVARALGVTQSAIYRHVRDMDELVAVASEHVVSELTAVLESILVDPDIEWGTTGDIDRMSRRLAAMIDDHGQAFEIVDRWRFDPGALGQGIRGMLAGGTDLIGELLSARWMEVNDLSGPLSVEMEGIVRAHALLLQDDVIATARARREGATDDEAATADVLGLRLQAGWLAFCLDANDRCRLPAPRLVFS